jgi:lipocalin
MLVLRLKFPMNLFNPKVQDVKLKVKSIFYNGSNQSEVMKIIGSETPISNSTFSVPNVYFIINEYLGNYWVLSEKDYKELITK